MAQIITGIRAILANPFVYESVQKIMGADKARRKLVSEFIDPYTVRTILDIGCGPAAILEYLSDVEYYGFDVSEPYIDEARSRFGDKGKFIVKNLCLKDVEDLPQCDMVLMSGVLHHLDDDMANNVLNIANKALKQGGRLLTIDPVIVSGQNPIARLLINIDRGQNVRTKEGYANLVEKVFKSNSVEVRHKAWIPYTHCIMECKRL